MASCGDMAAIHLLLSAYRILGPDPDRTTAATLLGVHGREWTGAARPSRCPLGPPRACFENTLHLCVDHPELTYVEGYAVAGMPLHHAWAVDRSGRVVDTTWDDPQGRAYFGIPFNTAYAKAAAFESGLYSVLMNWKFQRVLTDAPSKYLSKTFI